MTAQRVEVCRAVGTQALRQARNRQLFLDQVQDTLGLAVEVLAPEAEARLSLTGVLTTLAVVARIDNAGGPSTGAVFFFGLAATFIVVLLATRMSWAIWPAAGLALVAVFILVGQSRFINYLWPVLLIAAGLFILFRVWRPANR
jgi:hypothetical protein